MVKNPLSMWQRNMHIDCRISFSLILFCFYGFRFIKALRVMLLRVPTTLELLDSMRGEKVLGCESVFSPILLIMDNHMKEGKEDSVEFSSYLSIKSVYGKLGMEIGTYSVLLRDYC